MLTSFSTALSALDANLTAIDVVGNNLANLNTAGFKNSSLSFHDMMTQSMSGGLGATQVGFGVGTPITLRNFSQGAIQSTGAPLDVAIQGDGFFVVNTPGGATEYTRAGNFQVNLDGNLVTATGEKLQGWSAANNVVNTNAPTGPITVPTGTLASPRATTTTSLDLNLDASASTGAANGTFASSVEVFDSLGTSHIVTFTFTKTATPNQWTYSAGLPAGDTTPASTPATGTLTFDANGQLITPAANAAQPVIAASNLNDGAANLSITWNLYNGATPRLTQFAQASATSAIAQDGAESANLVGVSLSDGGKVLAQYSNGQQIAVGQLAVATIRNPETLIGAGNSNFQTSALTAAAVVGVPGTGGRGTVLGGAIESSTVDIAREFTNLIVYQRGYEANAHVITTADQLSQDTINLKQ
jgi:flagellar hook protein FlgE